jgi:hypothetical protein
MKEVFMREILKAHRSFDRRLKARDHLEDLDREGCIILNLF